jgi:hypothetical protein
VSRVFTEETWRATELNDRAHWVTVKELNTQVLRRLDELQPSHPTAAWNRRDLGYLIDHWTFPLTDLELTKADVKVDQLRAASMDRLRRRSVTRLVPRCPNPPVIAVSFRRANFGGVAAPPYRLTVRDRPPIRTGLVWTF